MWECGLKLEAAYDLGREGMSLLMWECGLKLKLVGRIYGGPQVTPYVGVWIETSEAAFISTMITVTPYVGVWIETITGTDSLLRLPVTPYVGVWIETRPGGRLQRRCACHSLCGSVD